VRKLVSCAYLVLASTLLRNWIDFSCANFGCSSSCTLSFWHLHYSTGWTNSSCDRPFSAGRLTVYEIQISVSLVEMEVPTCQLWLCDAQRRQIPLQSSQSTPCNSCSFGCPKRPSPQTDAHSQEEDLETCNGPEASSGYRAIEVVECSETPRGPPGHWHKGQVCRNCKACQ
jgi:hypothetical protein